MRLRFLAVLLLCLGLWIEVTRAQVNLPLTGVGATVSSGSYTGPGDVVSGAIAWFGWRGYNAAYSGNVAQICDSATGLVCGTVTWTAAGGISLPTIGGGACNNTTNLCVVSEMYDQSGGNNCAGGPCNVTQGTNANRPPLTVSCQNGRPCMACNAATPTWLNAVASLTATQTQPYTYTTVFNRTGNFTNYNTYFFSNGSGGVSTTSNNVASGSGNAAAIYAGSVLTAAATDSALHAMQAVYNGASSGITIDGSTTSGAAGSASQSGIYIFCNSSNTTGLNPATAIILEAGSWAGAFSGGNLSAMNTNIHSATSGWNF